MLFHERLYRWAFSWKSYTVELFHERAIPLSFFDERAIPLSFFTKGLYRWAFSRNGYTVKLFQETAIPLSFFTKRLYRWVFSRNGYTVELFSWKGYTFELFHERAIPLSFFTKGLYSGAFFTKGLYRWAFSRKGYTVELFSSEATTVLSWQQPSVVSQQRLRLRRLTLVMRVYVPKLEFEPVSFLFWTCFSTHLESVCIKTLTSVFWENFEDDVSVASFSIFLFQLFLHQSQKILSCWGWSSVWHDSSWLAPSCCFIL